MQIQMYFDTTGLSPSAFEKSVKQAKKQNDRVLAILVGAGKALTPFEVHAWYCKYFPTCPVTSIRRAMNTLACDGKLIKTNELGRGVYGKDNHKWQAV